MQRRPPTDSLGNPVTLHDPESLPALNDFIEGFIACEARAVNVLLHAANDPSALVQAYCAALHMFAESAQGPTHARPFIARALALLARTEAGARPVRLLGVGVHNLSTDEDAADTFTGESRLPF